MVSWYGRGENASACVVASCALSPRPASTGTPRPPGSRSSVAPSIYRLELVAGGLESEAARAFLASMPTAEALMAAAPSVAEIEAAHTGRLVRERS